MELHPTWKIVNICLKCFCIVHASCCHVMKKGGEIFKVICCSSAPLICGFCFYSNSNGTNIQFWWIWILTWVSSFFVLLLTTTFTNILSTQQCRTFLGPKQFPHLLWQFTRHLCYKKQLKLLLKVPQAQGKGLCLRSPHHKTNTVNQREEENS